MAKHTQTTDINMQQEAWQTNGNHIAAAMLEFARGANSKPIEFSEEPDRIFSKPSHPSFHNHCMDWIWYFRNYYDTMQLLLKTKNYSLLYLTDPMSVPLS